jgi:hypothetical protein
VLSIVLFGIGAMAVDLGNGYARKRSTQTDADLAVLAGGGHLNGTSTGLAAARSCAYQFLMANLPRDDSAPAAAAPAAPSCSTVQSVPNTMTDGSLDNGEICFPSSDVSDTCVTDSTTRIKVVVPARTVNFGLANAIGFSSVTVSATASVEIKSLAGLLAPFALPATCASGTQSIKDTSNGQNTGSNLSWHPSNGNDNNLPAITGLAFSPSNAPQTGASLAFPAGTARTIDVYGTNFDNDSLVALVTTGARTDLTPSSRSATKLTVVVPASTLVDRYYLQASSGNNANKWSPADVSHFIDVGIPPESAGTCNSATGDFGIINSPRKDVTNGSSTQALDRNLALGGDHGLAIFGSPPAPNTNCGSGNNPIAGAIWDNNPNLNTANCLDIENGNKVSQLTAGLVTGNNAVTPGRLSAPPSPGCAGATGVNPTTIFGNNTINNDILSCFLIPGATLKQLNGVGGSAKVDHVLRSDIVKSPRFIYVPVINTTVNPQNGWWPIIGFVGAFITDETPTSAATSANGLSGSAQKLTEVDAYVFPLSALPESFANDGATIPYLGVGPVIPVLVN